MEENKNNEIEMNSEVKQTNAQQVKTKKKSKVVPVLVTIILILVLALALCIGNMYAMTKDYDNVFEMVSSMISGQEASVEEKEEINEDANKEQENNEISNILEDENKDYVYERAFYESKYIVDHTELKIPYINIKSEDAKMVNQEIYKMYEKASNEIKVLEEKNHNPSDVYEYTALTYKYSIIGNVLCVCVDKTPLVSPGGGFVRQRTVYNFNLQDGKTMSIQEVLREFDLTETKLIQKINLKFKEMYLEGMFDAEWNTEKQFIEGFEYDINEVYFESDTTVELILEGDSVPMGDWEIKLDISNDSHVSESYDKEQVQSIIQGFLNINKYYMGHPSAVLIELGYVKDIMEYEQNSSRTNEGWLVSNNIKYSDFKNKMLGYMSEELYQEKFKMYKDVNGYLALNDSYGKPGNEARVNKIDLVTLENNLYTFMVEFKGYYKQPGGDTEEYDIKSKFEVQKNESGKYVISKYEEL